VAHAKFIIINALFSCLLINITYANPTSEEAELRANKRENRGESPRIPRVITPPREIRNLIAQPTEESCCWSVLNVFCTLMAHAGNSAPHPIIVQRREK
jgi:hypothetical protein